MSTVTRAATEWFRRPPDERYLSLDDLYSATYARASACSTSLIETRNLRAYGDSAAGGRLMIEEPSFGLASPTDWSTGQAAAVGRTPLRWLKGSGTEASALRALLGPEYGRIFDHDVVAVVREVNEDGRWHIPAASYQVADPLRATTLYASDRDIFLFLVDEANPVNVTVGGTTRQLFRGFMLWNSEVGSKRLGLLTILYDFVCDNRLVHGARGVLEEGPPRPGHPAEAGGPEIGLPPRHSRHVGEGPRGARRSLLAQDPPLPGLRPAYSGPRRPLIPIEGDHPFRLKTTTDSGGKATTLG